MGIQGAEISAEARVLTQCGDFGVSGGECELQRPNSEGHAGWQISPEQQRERWLARAVQRGWLRTSVPAPELEAVVPVRGGVAATGGRGGFHTKCGVGEWRAG